MLWVTHQTISSYIKNSTIRLAQTDGRSTVAERHHQDGLHDTILFRLKFYLERESRCTSTMDTEFFGTTTACRPVPPETGDPGLRRIQIENWDSPSEQRWWNSETGCSVWRILTRQLMGHDPSSPSSIRWSRTTRSGETILLDFQGSRYPAPSGTLQQGSRYGTLREFLKEALYV